MHNKKHSNDWVPFKVKEKTMKSQNQWLEHLGIKRKSEKKKRKYDFITMKGGIY